MNVFNLASKLSLDKTEFEKNLTAAEKSISNFEKDIETASKTIANLKGTLNASVESLKKIDSALNKSGEEAQKAKEKHVSLYKNIQKLAKSAASSAANSVAKLVKEISTVAPAIAKTTTKATKAAATIVAAIGTISGAVVGVVSKVMDYTGEIDDNAQHLNMSTEQYQTWAFAVQKAGADVSTLETATRQLTDWTNKLSEGNGEAILSMKELGISYSDFSQMDTAGQLQTVVEALQGLESQTDKTRLAQEIFGNRAYQQLMPLLNEEQGSFDALSESLKEQGAIIEDGLIKQGAELGDELQLLQSSAKSAGTALAADFLPDVSLVTEGLQGLMAGTEGSVDMISEGIIDVFSRIIEKLPELLSTAVDIIRQIIDGISKMLPNIMPDIILALKLIIKAIADILPQLTDILFEVISGLLDAIIELLPDLVPVLSDLIEQLLYKIVEILPDLMYAFIDLVTAVVKVLMSIDWGKFVTKLLKQIISIAFEVIPSLNILKGLVGLIFGNSDEIMNGVGINLGKSLVNGLIQSIEQGINLIIGVINGATSGISSVWNKITGKNSNIPEIPTIEIPWRWYAEGGMLDTIAKGTVYAVAGESGAEIVANGRYGTGVANVEQIADAQYLALNDYGLKEAIANAAIVIVNGFAEALTMRQPNIDNQVTVKIGEQSFSAYVVNIVNTALKSMGRIPLYSITSY